MADDLVQRRHQVLGFRAVLAHDADLFGRGRKFLERTTAGGSVKRATGAGEQEALRTVLLVHFAFVGQVVADRCHVEVARFDDRFDGLGGGRLDALFAILVGPRRAVFEILSLRGHLLHERVHLLVGDADEGLRGALGAAGVAIDFDEAVGVVDARVGLHPGDAGLDPGVEVAGLVVADESVDRLSLLGFGVGFRLGEVLVGLGEVFGVVAGLHFAVGRAGAVDLLFELARREFHESRVERVLFDETLQVREADVGVEIVRAGLEDVLAATGALGGHHRLELGIEDGGFQVGEFLVELSSGAQRGAVLECLVGGGFQFFESEFGQNLLRGVLVVIAAIGPEQLGVGVDFREGGGIDAGRMRHHRFEQVLLAEAEPRLLVVDDGIDRDGGLGEPIGERLFAGREVAEAVGGHLDESGGADALHQLGVEQATAGDEKNERGFHSIQDTPRRLHREVGWGFVKIGDSPG